MTLTARQSEALDVLLESNNCLLYGGARSGKTALAVYFLIYVGLTFPGARMLVARRYATDIRGSIWGDTLVKVPRLLGLELGKEFKTNEQMMTMSFPNGSEIVCAGLDDKERVDKILGSEYAIIYINESQDVSWNTVKTIKTRLAQQVKGFRNRFLCDLNPTSMSHWTYSLWFEGLVPDSKKPVIGGYGKIQMNPIDNQENIAEGFIEEQLEGLTGEARKRFLLGEYSNNSELQVFKPVAWFEEDDFLKWAHGRWHEIEVTAGLDLGFEDADAFVMMAYVDGCPDVWLIEEYKARQNDTSTLAKDVKRIIATVWAKYPLRERAKDDFIIWTDSGGLGKKTAQELANSFELPCRAAYKRDKDVGLFFVQDDVNYGRLHLQKDGPFADECKKAVWKRDEEGDMVTRVLDDKVFHPDVLDAVIYAYRYLMKHGNSAMMGKMDVLQKDTLSDKGYYDILSEVEKAFGTAEAVW